MSRLQLSPPWRVALGVVIIILLLALVEAVNGYMIYSANQSWCSALSLLTSQPVAKPADPKANPSREAGYELYEDFVQIRHNFHC